ncbi:hypothetical protein BJX63DRAFT_416249 [Aspergillus granulosus]|uniref:Uncharacterized protein n=1 Tax=Aspergillus granulosus TaxID=176169 RepID=A0ABR4GS57_9EURO
MISSAGGEFGMSKGVIILIIEILARLDRPFEITTTYCESTRRFVNQAKYTEN